MSTYYLFWLTMTENSDLRLKASLHPKDLILGFFIEQNSKYYLLFHEVIDLLTVS